MAHRKAINSRGTLGNHCPLHPLCRYFSNEQCDDCLIAATPATDNLAHVIALGLGEQPVQQKVRS
jgi:hypothetical protein